MILAFSEISCVQSKHAQHTKQECQKLMNHAATHPNVIVRCCASDMVLHVDSDAACLVLPKARITMSGCFQLSNYLNDNCLPFLDVATLVVCKILQHVVSSATESETTEVFYNFQLSISIRCMLEALNHRQPVTPVKTENLTTNGFVHNNMNKND